MSGEQPSSVGGPRWPTSPQMFYLLLRMRCAGKERWALRESPASSAMRTKIADRHVEFVFPEPRSHDPLHGDAGEFAYGEWR